MRHNSHPYATKSPFFAENTGRSSATLKLVDHNAKKHLGIPKSRGIHRGTKTRLQMTQPDLLSPRAGRITVATGHSSAQARDNLPRPKGSLTEPSSAHPLPKRADVVLRDRGVVGYERHLLYLRLRDEQAVERVGVVGRQPKFA